MSTKILLLIALISIILIMIIFYNRKRIINKAKKILIKEIKDPIVEEKAQTEKTIEKTEEIISKYSIQEIKQSLRRAEILLEHKEDIEAEKILVSILSIDSNNIDAHIFLASLFVRQKKFSRAEVLYKELINLENEKNVSTLSNYAYCLFEQNKLEDSVIYYQKALERDKNNVKRYTNLGQVLFVCRSFDEAIKLFKKAIRLKPRDTEILFMLADTYREAKKYKEAKETYLKVLYYEPYNEEAREEIIKIDYK